MIHVFMSVYIIWCLLGAVACGCIDATLNTCAEQDGFAFFWEAIEEDEYIFGRDDDITDNYERVAITSLGEVSKRTTINGKHASHTPLLVLLGDDAFQSIDHLTHFDETLNRYSESSSLISCSKLRGPCPSPLTMMIRSHAGLHHPHHRCRRSSHHHFRPYQGALPLT